MALKVTLLDHSGFLVETDKELLVFDDYRDPSRSVVRTIEHHPNKPVVFFVTHRHPDHFNRYIFNIGQQDKRRYVLSSDIPGTEVNDNAPVDWIENGRSIENIFGDITVRAFGSTDAGVSLLVTLGSGETIFYAGDLNFWHWEKESTAEEVQKQQSEFTKILGRISEEINAVDIAFFPVDVRLGDNCAAGAEQFLTKISVKDFFPMHFNGDHELACGALASDMPEDVAKSTTIHCLYREGEHITLS